jgi:hypothetical protein
MGSAQDVTADADAGGMKRRQRERNAKSAQRRAGLVKSGFL